MKEFKGCKNYTVISKEELKDIGATGFVLRHDKTGARVVLLQCRDENKAFMVGFKTPQYESTGVPHILEHSVLCGSEKFPVKDAMTEVSKGSLYTFLNAFTYPDRTVYPVASCNDKDFKNLMDVYLDAVFFPRVYKEKKIFMQEGWHYEMTDKEGELTYNGVVYNEMKGVYSSPDSALSSYVLFSLFPDTQYGVESGGDPDVIPDLTYERFVDFHRTLYHPSNSRIYLYGDMDFEERLEFIDREYLSRFEEKDVNPEIRFQKPFVKPVRIEKSYPVENSEDDEESGTYLTYNLVVSDYRDVLTTEAVDVINYALCNVPGALLKTRLIDAGICNDVYSEYETDICQKTFSIVAQDARPEDEERFVHIVEDTLREISEKGFDKKTLEAAITSSEFSYREGDFGYLPKGIYYGVNILEYWNYSDDGIFANIQKNNLYKTLRKGIEEGLFEKVLREKFLENPHKTILVMKPDDKLSARKDAELEDKLAKIKAGLSDKEKEAIIRETKELKEYQEAPDSKEAIDTVPTLKLSDISKEAKYVDYTVGETSGVKEIISEIDSNGIAYITLSFDASDLPGELVEGFSFLRSVLGYVDTKDHSYGDLINEINIKTGGISANGSIYTNADDADRFGISFEIIFKVLYDRIPDAFALIKEVLFTSAFNDKKRIKEILEQARLRTQGYMMQSGHAVALGRTNSYVTDSGRIKELLSGLDWYRSVERILGDYDKEFKKLSEGMKKVLDYVLTKDRIEISVGADKEGIAKVNESFAKFVKDLPETSLKGEKLVVKAKDRGEGLTFASSVQYVGMAGNFKKAGLPFTGALLAMKSILGNDYLWTGVRLKGGAYGVMCGFGRTGFSYFVSYRDPGLLQTVEVYKGAADYIRNLPDDKDFTDRYIITAVADLDAPLTPSMKAAVAYGEYKSEVTRESMQKTRDQLLSTDASEIRSLARYIEAVIENPAYCTVGGTNKIKEEGDLFKEIVPLYKG
ncbi:MAG: insulinase family protein [Lachnospiraceae bacterium]|nr:insulinase family protein [Lachnospiraceae bacterium]